MGLQSRLKELELVEVEKDKVGAAVEQQGDAQHGELAAERLVAGPPGADAQEREEVDRGQDGRERDARTWGTTILYAPQGRGTNTELRTF